MNIKTIEERLAAKAEKIGEERAKGCVPSGSTLRDAFKLCHGIYVSGSEKSKILHIDTWDISEVVKTAMVKYHQEQALEELRSELLSMSDRLLELTEES